MHDRSEVFNIVAGNGYFFFRIMVHCKKERPVILGFYFINHGKINNISFMGPENPCSARSASASRRVILERMMPSVV